ncbi:MAG TPA: gas vesicle protein GvpJ [Jatrophihabitans sp.]|jgi:hypothetical protein
MTMANRDSGYLSRPAPSGLADVIEVILDKGLVIDAYVRVSLVGIELLTIDARIVIASVDTYLRFAEATNRLDLYEHGGKDLPELFNAMQEGGAKHKTKGALSGVKEKFSDAVNSGDDGSNGGGRSRNGSRRTASAGSRRRREDSDE